jgi:hypothetical protein
MMLEFLKNLLSPDGYMPHGQCYLWQTSLVRLHVVSDALTAIAYFSIQSCLFTLSTSGKTFPFSFVFAMFGASLCFAALGTCLIFGHCGILLIG